MNCIGKIKTIDGTLVSGFLSDTSMGEWIYDKKAVDISEYGDWRKYIAATKK